MFISQGPIQQQIGIQMKKNTTASKASLKHVAREQPVVVRHPKKPEQASMQQKPKRNINNFVGFGEAQEPMDSSTLVRCNNCGVMIQRELVKLHSNVCSQGRKMQNPREELVTCKDCQQKIPLHLFMSHVSACNGELAERDNPRGKHRNPNKHNEYSEMPREVRESRHSRDRPDSQRKNIETDKYHKELHKRNNNHNARRPNPRQTIETVERPNSRQKQLLMRARTNDIQQKIRQKQKEQERIRQERLEKQRRQRLRQQRERERQRQRERERERERAAHQQQRQPQPTPTTHNQTRRRVRRNARSNSRRPRRQNSLPGVNFFPINIFHQIQTGLEQLRINSHSFEHQMQNLSNHFGYVMENFSNLLMSPLGNQRRRVIWYEEDIYPDMSDAYDSGAEEDIDDQGLPPEEIDDIPVHQYNSRRTHPHADTTSKSCAVCLSDFIHGQTVKALYCAHKFHQECIDRWLEMKGTCPVCREDLRG